MIDKAIQFTVNALNQYVKNKFSLDDDVVLANKIIDQDGTIPQKNKNKITISLIHLEEETVKQFYQRKQPLSDGNYTKKPVSNRYNLFVLLTPNFDDYNEALKFLSAGVQFFQNNALIDATKNGSIPKGIERLEYEFQKGENYMQMQNLWTALGAKYQPSVIYKIRLVSISSDEIEGFEAGVTQINNTTDVKL